MEKTAFQLLLQPSVSGVAICACVTAHGGHFSTFCGVFMVQCVKLMFCLSIKCNLLETFYQVRALRK